MCLFDLFDVDGARSGWWDPVVVTGYATISGFLTPFEPNLVTTDANNELTNVLARVNENSVDGTAAPANDSGDANNTSGFEDRIERIEIDFTNSA